MIAKLSTLAEHAGEFNVWCFTLALFTFGISKVPRKS